MSTNSANNGQTVNSGLAYRIVSTNSDSSTSTTTSTPQVQALLASPINGQFYVLGNPSDVLGTVTARSLAPRVSSTSNVLSSSAGGGGLATDITSPKDERRRATHNEVERRRRDNINTWIHKLSKLIPPEASVIGSGSGGAGSGNEGGAASKSTRSKGDILARACEYVTELRNTNHRLLERVDHRDRIALENERLQSKVSVLQNENAKLRRLLESNGLTPPPEVIEEGPGPTGTSILG